MIKSALDFTLDVVDEETYKKIKQPFELTKMLLDRVMVEGRVFSQQDDELTEETVQQVQEILDMTLEGLDEMGLLPKCGDDEDCQKRKGITSGVVDMIKSALDFTLDVVDEETYKKIKQPFELTKMLLDRVMVEGRVFSQQDDELTEETVQQVQEILDMTLEGLDEMGLLPKCGDDEDCQKRKGITSGVVDMIKSALDFTLDVVDEETYKKIKQPFELTKMLLDRVMVESH